MIMRYNYYAVDGNERRKKGKARLVGGEGRLNTLWTGASAPNISRMGLML